MPEEVFRRRLSEHPLGPEPRHIKDLASIVRHVTGQKSSELTNLFVSWKTSLEDPQGVMSRCSLILVGCMPYNFSGRITLNVQECYAVGGSGVGFGDCEYGCAA
jgi:hypothetical protein